MGSFRFEFHRQILCLKETFAKDIRVMAHASLIETLLFNRRRMYLSANSLGALKAH